MAKILIVSKDESFVELISPWFKEKGHEVKKETKLSEGLRLLDTHQSDMVILDLTIPQTEPYDELINRYISDLVSRRVIITGGYLTGNRMQEYIKQEALDVFEKPLKLQTGFTGEGELKERLMASLSRALSFKQSSLSLGKGFKREDIIGHSDAIMACVATLEKAAKTNEPILIRGESGTGKELFAKAVHENSTRSKREFKPVNCAGLNEPTAVGDLFGYKKGAHSTADKDKDGLIKSADGGTLFLDEVGDVPLTIQASLLRCLEEKEVLPLAALVPEKSDFRLVSATNQNLEQKLSKGEFRLDFYSRISTFVIHLPPLRNRKEDIEDIASHFIRKNCKELDIKPKTWTPDFMDALKMYDWRDNNVRELRNVIASTVAQNPDNEILEVNHLPPQILGPWIGAKGHVVHEPSEEEKERSWKEVLSAVEGMSKDVKVQAYDYAKEDDDTEVDEESWLPNETSTPVSPTSNEPPVEITPENMIAGKIKWNQIEGLEYSAKVALVVAARSLWKKPKKKKDLAKILNVRSQNAFEQFYRYARKKVRDNELHLEDLKRHVSCAHHEALEKFVSEALAGKSVDPQPPT